MTSTDRWLIAGLGNPGKTYAHTRHNIGFMAIDNLSAHYKITLNRNMFKNLMGRGSIDNIATIIAQPMDYMNRSGPPVCQLARYFDIHNENILIIHDDMDLDSGRIKIKAGGGHGGHKGVRSIIDTLGTNEFTRIRIGIGRPSNKPDVTDFVLGKISKHEMDHYRKVLETVRCAVETILKRGPSTAMNEYNEKL